MKILLGALALALTVAAGPRVEAAGDGVDVTLQAPPEVHTMRLRLEGTAVGAHACTGPCALHVSPGRYELELTDDRGQSTAHSLDLVRSESIAVVPPRHRLVTAGAVVAVSGLVLAGVSGAIFSYGVIHNIRVDDCAIDCGRVSREALILSIAGLGTGVALGVVGTIVAVAAGRPTVTEHPEPAATGTAMSWVVVPGPDGRSAQAAVAGRF